MRGVVDHQVEGTGGQVRVDEAGERRAVALIEAHLDDQAIVKALRLDELGEQLRDLWLEVDGQEQIRVRSQCDERGRSAFLDGDLDDRSGLLPVEQGEVPLEPGRAS